MSQHVSVTPRAIRSVGRAMLAGTAVLALALACVRGQTSDQTTPQFLFGFNQVAGFASPVDLPRVYSKPETWALTDEELATLKNDFHVNALRFFVHPALKRTADTLIKLLREQTLPKKWFWAETAGAVAARTLESTRRWTDFILTGLLTSLCRTMQAGFFYGRQRAPATTRPAIRSPLENDQGLVVSRSKRSLP